MSKELTKSFQELINGSQTVAGTNSGERSRVWELFRKEYSDYVVLVIDGIEIKLNANHSVSGKSTTYFSDVSKEVYKKLMGSDFGLKKTARPYIMVNAGIIEISGGGKFYSKISNSRVSHILPF